MRIRKLIKEELSDLSWIKNSKSTLKDKIIEFEPMLNFEEWNQVLDLLMAHVVTFDEDIIWWGDILLDDFQPLEEGQYLHHLIIANSGQMVYGGMDLDMADTLRDDGYSEDEIANAYDEFYDSIDLFLDDHPGKFDSPETIDGRKYFNIPYKKPIQESEDFFNSIRDDENKPKIIPGGIIDTYVGNFSRYEILQRLHELGYEWLHGDKIFVNGELSFVPFRYIFIGPIGGNVTIGELKLLHDEDLNWINSEGLSDLVYRT